MQLGFMAYRALAVYPYVYEIFPSASYQYVLYGMRFKTQPRATSCPRDSFEVARKFFRENELQIAKQSNGLPSNRELIDYLADLTRHGATE